MEYKFCGLIVAKKYNSSFLNKHLYKLENKKIINHVFDNSLKSKKIAQFFFSSDSKKLISIAKEYKKINIPFIRPKSLSKKNSPIKDVISHFIGSIKESYTFDYVVLLQGSSPFRKSNDIDNAIKKFLRFKKKNKNARLVSVKKLEKKFNWIITISKNKVNFLKKNTNISFRQRNSHIFLPNGAIYIFPFKKFDGNLYNNSTTYYLMSEKNSLDVDTIHDIKKIC